MQKPFHLSNRKGLALPMTLFFIVVVSASLAAALSSTTAEIVTNNTARGQARAYHIAQSGLEQFLVRRGEKVAGQPWCDNCSDPVVADSEWTRVSLPGGYADIVAVKVRPVIGKQHALYFIRSKGVDTSIKLSNAMGQNAERTVGVYAYWNTSVMNVKAAWLSLSGLTKNGTGIISGIDQCGEEADVAGVMVPSGGELIVVNGNSFHPSGSPPVDTANTFNQLKDSVKIDWAGVLAGNALIPDITIPGGSFPSAADFDNDPDYWPVIRVKTNNFSLPNRGRGTIIADSNFVISGSNMWDGIVLVGGSLTSNGNNTTAGATLSGLNYLIGGTPADNVIDDAAAEGQKTYVYNSCNVNNAAARLKRYAAIPNSWVDNVASW